MWDTVARRPSDFCPFDEAHCAAGIMCAYYPQFHARICAELRAHYGDKSQSLEVTLGELGIGADDVVVVGWGDQITDPGEMERTVELVNSDLLHAALCVVVLAHPSRAPACCLWVWACRQMTAGGLGTHNHP